LAESPAHKFGQIIGDALEKAIEPILTKFAEEHRLYLDRKGSRPTRAGNKVTWTDLYGNGHDLDFVLERDGARNRVGVPVAFIETAWRRYTKHSRNKAQEIQGALLPLVETYSANRPFIGVILAGVFTEGAVTQLRSQGFTAIVFPYESVIAAFAQVGIDADFDESTPDSEFADRVSAWNSLSAGKLRLVREGLVATNMTAVEEFVSALDRAIMRQVVRIRIAPLHGRAVEWQSVEEALHFLKDYSEAPAPYPLYRYEVTILFTNGDRVSGEFAGREDAIEFLRSTWEIRSH
jgi:hypothetical protein